MAEARKTSLHLEVVTPRAAVLSDDVSSIVLPGWDGELEQYPSGRPLLCALRPGRMICRHPGADKTYYVGGGYAEVLADRVVVLADECDPADALDAKAGAEALQEAMKALEEHRHDPYETLEPYLLAQKRAQARIDLGRSGPKG